METSSQVRLKLSSLATSPQASIWRLRLMWIQLVVMSPMWGGHCFWCGSRLRRRWRQRSLLEELHLRNLWVDSHQTMPGWRKTVFRFWWPWPHLQGHSPQTVNFGLKWRICSLSMKFGQTWFNISLQPAEDLFRFRWLSWMRRPTGDQEVAGSTPAVVGNILSWRMIMKYFLRSFSPFRWFKKGSCQFLAK